MQKGEGERIERHPLSNWLGRFLQAPSELLLPLENLLLGLGQFIKQGNYVQVL